MSKKKPTVEYRWEAYNPETGAVAKRGPIREDISKVRKYADEIQDGIRALGEHGSIEIDGWHLAPYWDGLEIRIVTRTITPWIAMETETSEAKV